jgi:hypothetical protein
VAAESATAASDTCREIGDDGGYSGDHGPIPAAGKKRRTRQCFSAPRRSAGRRGTSAMDGGELGSLRRVLGERENQGEGKRNVRKRRSSWRPGKSLGVASVAWAQAGGGVGVFLGAPRTCFQLEEEDDVHFRQNPLNFVAFL